MATCQSLFVSAEIVFIDNQCNSGRCVDSPPPPPNSLFFIHCFFFQASDLFYQFPKDDEASIMNVIRERRMSRAVTLHPITNPLIMYKIHRYLTELELNRTFVETRTLQNSIKDMLPYLPDGKCIFIKFGGKKA